MLKLLLMNLKWCTWTAKVPCASKNVDDFTMSQKCLRFSAWVVWWSIFSCPLCKAADLYKAPHRKTTVNPRSRNILLSPKASKSPLSWLLSWSSQLLFSWMASNWITFFFATKRLGESFVWENDGCEQQSFHVIQADFAGDLGSYGRQLRALRTLRISLRRWPSPSWWGSLKGVKWGLGWCFRSRRLGAIHVNEIGHCMV